MKSIQKLRDYATAKDDWYIEKMLVSLELEVELKAATNKTLSDFLNNH